MTTSTGGGTTFNRREYCAIGGIALAYFLVIFDAGVLNLALPSIQASFHVSLSQAQWVLDAYSLPLAALLMGTGRLGDRFGHRKLLVSGVAIFTIASIAAMASPTFGQLVGARAAEGIGGAIMLPATLATISHAFRGRAARARATMIWVGTGAAAMAVAPVAGGALLSAWGWQSIFAINVPLGTLSITLILRGMSETSSSPSTRLKLGAQVLLVLVLGSISGGVVTLGDQGASTGIGLGLIAAGVLAGCALVVINARTSRPLIPHGYFSQRARSAAIVSAGAMGFAFYGSFLALSILFQSMGRSAIDAGVMLLPMTVASVGGPLFAYRTLAKRFQPQTVLVGGFSIAAAGSCLVATANMAPYTIVVVGMVTVGAMSTVCFSALTTLLMTHTEPEQSGLSSGLQNTTRQAGSLLAYSIIGAILAQGSFGIAMGVVVVACASCALMNIRARSELRVNEPV